MLLEKILAVESRLIAWCVSLTAFWGKDYEPTARWKIIVGFIRSKIPSLPLLRPHDMGGHD